MAQWHALPPEIYTLVERRPGTVLLESAPGGGVSRLFLDPQRVLEARDSVSLLQLFLDIETATAAGLYAAGWFAYECGGALEPAAAGRARAYAPLAWLGVYARAYVFDHGAGRFVGDEPPGLAGLRAPDATAARVEMQPALSEVEFARRIEAIHAWIRAGDVYQLNFTFPLRGRAQGGAAAVYARLRQRQPVEYGALAHWSAGRHVLSFSPELFFKVECDGGERRMTTRPMKGTARRGRTTAEDAALAAALRNDAKNRAENVMIVDLLRNDLGRLCRYGSVRTEELFAVERHSTLWQMTSTVTGLLRENVRAAEMMRALFPCGSVTGAPKVRAMQLIAELEQEARGVYAGAMGYFARESAVFSVAIRTLELEGEEARMGVGSGVVIDSRAEDEYRECLLKAEFLTVEQPEFALVETLKWRDGYSLLEMHLDRLADSAAYFGFGCARDAVRAVLLRAAESFRGAVRVRLLLDRAGKVRVESEPLQTAAEDELRVCVSPERMDAQDRFLYHKTTHRPVYAREFARAQAEGCADVVFLNRAGEVTEGAISNVFVEKDGQWFTPPVACGLLAGVYRRHLLETRPEIEEKVLRVEDLRDADAVYLANALRGLRKVEVQGIENRR